MRWWLCEVDKMMAPLHRNKTSAIHFHTHELSRQLLLLTVNLTLWSMKTILVALSFHWLGHKKIHTADALFVYTEQNRKIKQAITPFLPPRNCVWPSNMASTASFTDSLMRFAFDLKTLPCYSPWHFHISFSS